MGADQPRFKPDRLLKKTGAFWKALLLKADRAEHGICGRPRSGVEKRDSRLCLGFLDLARLCKIGSLLKRLPAVGRGKSSTSQDQENRDPRQDGIRLIFFEPAVNAPEGHPETHRLRR